ncbi:MAG TPA: cytochrome c [Candidatus Binatia bacterium]|nr:cytochrome c [Candidatus Binatia bacterium]
MREGIRIGAVVALALATAQCGRERALTASGGFDRGKPGVRVSMADLHRTGGVPPSWRFDVPPGDAAAGRRTFADLGCGSCHRVEGEAAFAADEAQGPDLTGMGGHHPDEYFAESILTPDAVLVEGPGYIGADGRSIMPSYPDVTLRQLADLVAYLKSLRTAGAAEMMAMAAPRPPSEVPPATDPTAAIYYVQVYDVLAGQLPAFETWFKTEGGPALRAQDGIVGIETWVDVTHDGPALTTVIGFRDDAALRRFLDDPSGEAVKARFDEFVGPHGHRIYRLPPVYRVATLSNP